MRLLPLLFAAALVHAAHADEPGANKPPRLSVEKNARAMVGQELLLSLNAVDPEGDLITFAADGLPPGAKFEARTGDLLWTPTDADVGTHAITFSASDGKATSYALVRIVVVARDPLRIDMVPEITAEVDKDVTVPVNAWPAPADVVVTGLPPGASWDPRVHAIRWRPGDADLGDHPVQVTAKNAAEQKTTTLVLHVRPPREEWMSYALPGIGYSAWTPLGSSDLGFFQGPSFEVVAVQWVHRNDNMGPSHGRVALKGDLLFPFKDPSDPAIIYAVQLALSLERNPERSWLLPYFAVDVGGLYQKQLGNAFQATPSIGVHIFQNRNIFISADVGYLLALPALEKLHGPRVSVSGNFTLW